MFMTERCPPQKVKLQIRYDGTGFEGWQRQAAGKRTVQEELEKALSRIFNNQVNVIGSGRTDSGVHAEAQIAHFLAPKDPSDLNLIHGINSLLPGEIAVEKAWLAPEDFHAQRSCLKKTYRYLIYNSPTPDPLKARYTTWYKRPINLETLNQMAAHFVGKKDFKSFQTSGTPLPSTEREILAAQWLQLEPRRIEFKITGTGFLKQMVRNIVGTMIYLEAKGEPPEEILRILEAKDRTAAKTTAPPEGLHLHHVEYPAELDNGCREI
jgi:tRNA pseudouridine38-40 synthase